MLRLRASARLPWPTSTLPESASAIERLTSGTVAPTMAAAVAYAAKALPKSSTKPPSSEGSRIGSATWRQYCTVVARLLWAASRHCTRRPSRAGVMVSTISGMRKYR